MVHPINPEAKAMVIDSTALSRSELWSTAGR